jgi:hypothetical protein
MNTCPETFGLWGMAEPVLSRQQERFNINVGGGRLVGHMGSRATTTESCSERNMPKLLEHVPQAEHGCGSAWLCSGNTLSRAVLDFQLYISPDTFSSPLFWYV